MLVDRHYRVGLALVATGLLSLPALAADPPAPISAQSTASFALAVKDGETIVDITNVAFATTGTYVPGRPTDELAWWSVYGLGDGRPMFDSHVPVLSFSITGEVETLRYTGLAVPPDDVADPRLAEPNVVGLVSYASAEKVIRQALITCDDA